MSPRIAVPLVAIAIAALLVLEGSRLAAAPLPLEEAAVAEQARGGPSVVAERIASAYPLALRPLVGNADGRGLLDVVRQLDALLWAALLFPAYVLARRRLPPWPALATASASVLVPAAVYAATLLPEAAATLLAAGSLALFAEGEARRRPLLLAAAAACAVAAALARPWLAALPAGLALAYALPRVDWRGAARWPRPLALLLLAGVVLSGLGGISGELERALSDPGAILRGALASLGAAAVGAAVLPWVAALALTGRARSDPQVALLVACTPLLALAAGIAVAGREPAAELDERPLLALAPLVFALAAAALVSPPSRRAALAAGGVVALAVLAIPVPLHDPALAGAPGLALAASASSRAALIVAALAALAAAALLWRGLAVAAVAAAAVVAIVAAGHAEAWRRLDAAADAGRAALDASPGWLDERAGGAGVTLLAAGPAPPAELLAQLAVGNRTLETLVPVDPARADPATGALPVAVPTPLALARGLELVGDELGRAPFGTLVRVAPPARLPVVVEGVYPDGWTGPRAVYRRLAGGGPGDVGLTLGRRAWTGPDVPGTVTVRSGRAGGELAVRAMFVVHAGEERRVVVPVPAPPFEIVVTVEPTFSPADFGQPDPRQLGVQVAFDEQGD